MAVTSMPAERPTSCKRAMMAAATAHPRRPVCAPGSIETSGSENFMRRYSVPCGAMARVHLVALYQLFHAPVVAHGRRYLRMGRIGTFG